MATGHGHRLAALALLLNAFIFGLSWWPFRQLQALGLHPLWATAVCYLLVLLVLLPTRPTAWRGLQRYPELWLLLAAAGLTNVGFNWAVTVGDVVRVVLLFYLMPAWAKLLAWWLLDERPTLASLVRLLLALAGVVLILKTPDSPWPLPSSLPDWLALLGGFGFALTNVLLRRLNHTPGDSRVLTMFAGGALCSGSVALLGQAGGIVTPLPAPAIAWLLLALAFSLILLLANLALQYGAARLSAHSTALIMLSEVVFASVSSVWLGAADISLRTLVGGALILLAALLAALA